MTGKSAFVWDSYRRLVQAYGEWCVGCPLVRLIGSSTNNRSANRFATSSELDAFAMAGSDGKVLRLYANLAGAPFSPRAARAAHLRGRGVFRSSRSPRAVEYRRLHGIEDLGTAVTVQDMVFGNMSSTSGSVSLSLAIPPRARGNSIWIFSGTRRAKTWCRVATSCSAVPRSGG